MQQAPMTPPPPNPHPATTGMQDASQGLTMHDAVALMKLTAEAGSQRNDPRAWRRELLEGLMRVVPASAAASFVIKGVSPESAPVIVSQMEAGFKGDAQRQAFREEFNAAGFRDLLSRRALDRFATGRLETLTAMRSELVSDPAWAADGHTQMYRLGSGVDDCILSVARGTEAGAAYVLYVFRPAAAAGETETGELGRRFAWRERTLLEALHQGLGMIYRAEEATQRLNRAAELPPRLRQTLECLLAGRTERQAAQQMKLSVHTVHDYVKALYQHFGVSSRGELMSKWIQIGGVLPVRMDSAG